MKRTPAQEAELQDYERQIASLERKIAEAAENQRQIEEGEWRVDPTDPEMQSYTRKEFLEYYGHLLEWDLAGVREQDSYPHPSLLPSCY